MNMMPDVVRHFWRLHVTIRVRLTLWYLLVLVGMLFSFAAFIHTRIESGLLEETDQTLKLAANQTRETILIEDGIPVFTQPNALADVIDDFTLRLVSPQGVIIETLGSTDPPVLKTLRAGYFDIETDDHHDRNSAWRVLSMPINDGEGTVVGWLQVTRPSDLRLVLKIIGSHFCLALPLGMLIAGIGGIWLARQALRPIDLITRTAQCISASDLQQRINYQGPPDEIGRLAVTLDNMFERLQAGFERERRFTGDAAHELRTPLTALKGQIGVTLSQPRHAEQYQATLRGLEDEVDRMIRLSSDLLLLARLDHSYHPAGDRIDLADLLGALCDQVLPIAKEKQITLTRKVTPNLATTGDMDLLIRLFLNLLDNAIKYTPPGGTVTIQTTAQADHIAIAINDTGPGIQPEHLPHLFERFFRGERDRARHHTDSPSLKRQGGAGLGLAIAQEIAHAHGGCITVHSEMGRGSIFTVELPSSVLP